MNKLDISSQKEKDSKIEILPINKTILKVVDFFLSKAVQIIKSPQYTLEGSLEELKSISNFVIVSNHSDNFDPFVIGKWINEYLGLDHNTYYIMKESLGKVPFLSKCGGIPIKRGREAAGKLPQEVQDFFNIGIPLKLQEKNTSFVIFPQGTRQDPNKPFKILSKVRNNLSNWGENNPNIRYLFFEIIYTPETQVRIALMPEGEIFSQYMDSFYNSKAF